MMAEGMKYETAVAKAMAQQAQQGGGSAAALLNATKNIQIFGSTFLFS